MQVFKPRYEVEKILAELREVFQSGWTGTGPKCQKFEKRFGEFLNETKPPEVLFLNSCTAALHLALKCLNLPKGSKVATTPITFCSTNHVILYEDLEPVFCDVNSKDISLSSDSVLRMIDEHDCRAVIWVHYGGNVSEEFYEFMRSKPKSVYVIEDCAHAAGAFYKDGTRVGSKADTISCFSFQSVKNLPTADSGAMVCYNPSVMARAKKLSWLGINKDTFSRTDDIITNQIYKWKYSVDEIGYKYNGNDVMAAIALAQLEVLDENNAFRRQLYNWYKQRLGGKLNHHDEGSSCHFVSVKCKDRDKAMAVLKAGEISPGCHYTPNYEFEPFRKFDRSDCKVTETVKDQLLTLPTHLNISVKNVDRVCSMIKNLV